MKRSDLTAYLDGELEAEIADSVEAELYEDPDYLDLVADLCRDQFLLAEHFAKERALAAAGTGQPAEPDKPVPRPRRIRSWPMPATIAVVVAISSLLVMKSFDIGGVNRSSGAVLHGAFTARGATLHPVSDHAVLFNDIWAVTTDKPAEVLYPDAPDAKITLKPHSRVRFFRASNKKTLEVIEGDLRIELPTHDPLRPFTIQSPAATIEVNAPDTKFTLTTLDHTLRLNLEAGDLRVTPRDGKKTAVKARRHVHLNGDGKVHNVGRKRGKTSFQLIDPVGKHPLPTAGDLRHNHHHALSFQRRRPIAVAVDFKKKLGAVQFHLAYQAPDAKTFTDVDPAAYRPNGKSEDPDPPYYVFGGNENPVPWTPDKPGVYRLRAVPVPTGKGKKPNNREQAIIFLHYR